MIVAAALIGFNAADAQTPASVKDSWEKTITVPASKASVIEKLFTAWGDQFSGNYVEAFADYKDDPEFYTNGSGPYIVEFAPKNGYLNIMATVQTSLSLTAVYWNLSNGNKLFAVSIGECHECPECGEENDYVSCEHALAFYEYEVGNNRLVPRADIAKKILSITDSPVLPKEGRDIEYYDAKLGDYKKIPWNGNGF